MSDSGDAASVPGFSGLGRGLAGRVRTLTSPPPPGRLASLRTRDLTLGGGFKKTKVISDILLIPAKHPVQHNGNDCLELSGSQHCSLLQTKVRVRPTAEHAYGLPVRAAAAHITANCVPVP